MLKKVLFYIMSSAVLSYGNFNDEVGFNITTTSIINEDSSKFSNYGIGGSFQMSRYIVSPRFDLEYVDISDYSGVNSLLKGSINGVYEFENHTRVLPYGLIGLGYERVTPELKDRFESHPFVQGGFGLAYKLTHGYKMKFEAKKLKILSGNNEGNEMMLSFGVSYPLGYRAKKIVKRVRRVQPLIPILVDEPKKERCPKKIIGADRDRDGVEDRLDQCPSTPCNFVVDSYGCPIKMTMRINFDIGSADIKEDSIYKISNFAHFLLRNRGSMVRVIGHTDSVGSDADNLALSIKRANAVVNKLLEMGVSPSRIKAEGKGERQPLVSNSTDEGKSKNRRIEIILSYPNIRKVVR